MGHEFSGVVVEVGDDAHNAGVKIGDRVVVEPIFRNPASVFTAKGEYNRSEPIGFIGLTGKRWIFCKICSCRRLYGT